MAILKALYTENLKKANKHFDLWIKNGEPLDKELENLYITCAFEVAKIIKLFKKEF